MSWIIKRKNTLPQSFFFSQVILNYCKYISDTGLPIITPVLLVIRIPLLGEGINGHTRLGFRLSTISIACRVLQVHGPDEEQQGDNTVLKSPGGLPCPGLQTVGMKTAGHPIASF